MPARRDTVRGYVIRTGGRVLDPSSECFIVELLGSEAEINGFMRDLATHAELIEVVRSGALGISRVSARSDWWSRQPRNQHRSADRWCGASPDRDAPGRHRAARSADRWPRAICRLLRDQREHRARGGLEFLGVAM
jgi:hypothetical protein